MHMSATLKAGHSAGSMKSVTPSMRTRSARLPSAPPKTRPTGSQRPGSATWAAKYASSPAIAMNTATKTIAPLPESAPKATPVFFTRVMSSRKKTLIFSCGSTLVRTQAFVSWSSATTTPTVASASAQPRSRVMSAGDDPGDDPGHEQQHDRADHRAQVDRARAEFHHRQETAPEVEVRIRGRRDEVHDDAERTRVRKAEPAHQDAGEDEHPVDQSEGVDVVRHVLARDRGNHAHRFVNSTTAVTASSNAARRPACSSAARP